MESCLIRLDDFALRSLRPSEQDTLRFLSENAYKSFAHFNLSCFETTTSSWIMPKFSCQYCVMGHVCVGDGELLCCQGQIGASKEGVRENLAQIDCLRYLCAFTGLVVTPIILPSTTEVFIPQKPWNHFRVVSWITITSSIGMALILAVAFAV